MLLHDRNDGRYYGQDDYASLSAPPLSANACTISGRFVWEKSGPGALLASQNGRWAIGYEKDGLVAYRVAGVERLTDILVASVENRWMWLALAKEGSFVVLRVNEREDRWEDAPIGEPTNGWVAMYGMEGRTADVSFFDRCLSDENLDAHWQAAQAEHAS